jgi:hypothetical protein
VLSDRFADGRLISDHYAIFVRFAGWWPRASSRTLPAACAIEPAVHAAQVSAVNYRVCLKGM